MKFDDFYYMKKIFIYIINYLIKKFVNIDNYYINFSILNYMFIFIYLFY